MTTTFDQPGQYERPASGTNALNSVLSRAYTINWEVAFYLVLLVVAVLTRTVNLGDRVMSHDESLHVKYSDELYREGRFIHTPLMHGPVLFHATALSFFMFGDNDFTGRLYPVILGIIMIFLPRLMFGKWLSKWSAAIISILITISPQLLFHHRYIREDIPAIFFSILMAYAIFAYIDGYRPRQLRFLALFAGAMLLNLASKETAFMYIAIFGLMLTLLLLVQLFQSYRRGAIGGIVGRAAVGAILFPVAGIIGAIAVVFLRIRNGYNLPNAFVLIQPTLAENGLVSNPGISISGNVLSVVYMAAIGIPIGLLIGLALMFAFNVVYRVISRPFEGAAVFVADNGKTLMQLVVAGVIIGGVAALVMGNIQAIIPPENFESARQSWAAYDTTVATLPAGQNAPIAPTVARPETMIIRTIVWAGITALIFIGVIILTAVIRFQRLPTLPWNEIVVLLVVALLSAAILTFFESRGRHEPVGSEEAVAAAVINYNWVDATWVVGAVCIAGLLFLRFRTSFFQQMGQFGAWDLLMVAATLIIPWTSAIPLFMAGYKLDASSYTAAMIEGMVLATIPFLAVSVVLGLCWNAGAWLVCAGVFYSLFVFFYTTVFTNAQGIGTGMVGSLGYWLVQQGVKRANQPQYYYTLIQVPTYEYLGAIASMAAGVFGMSVFWKWRANRASAIHSMDELQKQKNVEAVDSVDAVNAVEIDAGAFALREAESIAVAPTVNQAADFAVDSADLQARLDANPDLNAAAQDPDLDPRVVPISSSDPVDPEERVHDFPFIGFWGIWTVLITLALTIAGEKMPWLTTHIALPMTFVGGWYIGKLLESLDWERFYKQTWSLIVLIPLFVVGLANVVGPFARGTTPFGGLVRQQLLETFTWFGAGLLMTGTGYLIIQVARRTGRGEVIRMAILGVFTLLAILTTRTAFIASFVNYDYPTEYIGYAHGGPGNKTATEYLTELSRRTTDGMSIRFGYDDRMSWPGAWYFRDFPNGVYLGNVSSITNPEQYTVVMVSMDAAQKIDAQMQDKFVRDDLMRLWWPMEDYKALTLQRVDEAFGNPEWRNALWEIWFNRNYRPFAIAMDKDNPTRFDLDKWPVNDRMAFYVRKDIAATLWDLGVGGASATASTTTDAFSSLRCDTCAASVTYAPILADRLNFPRSVAFLPDGSGRFYVSDSRSSRIVLLNPDSVVERVIGTPSIGDVNTVQPLGALKEPWGIAVNAETGELFVADTWNHRIQVFNSAGEAVRTWGQFENVAPGAALNPTSFYGPRDVKLDAQGNVYVADTGNSRIRVYDSQGNWLRDMSAAEGQPGALREPVGLAVDNAVGELYIASTWNNKIVVYSLTGQYLREWQVATWAGSSAERDTGHRPYITLDRTNRYVFVTDPDVGRVVVYDKVGNPVVSFGKLVTENFNGNSFGILAGVTVDPVTGALYLVDAGSSRILRFDAGSIPGLAGQTNTLPAAATVVPVTAEPTVAASVAATETVEVLAGG